jgi:tetratricopeptide (TPR) repeat protein
MKYFAILLAAGLFAQTKNTPHCVTPAESKAPAPAAAILDGMGVVHFPITTSNPEAQKFFDQGIAQMHSFWTREAERSFRKAAELDPEAPMPWFGVAMLATGHFRPQFQVEAWDAILGKEPRTNKKAVEAVEKARALAAKPGKSTELERLYIEAIAAKVLAKSVDEADAAYVEGWRRLLAKYPKEVEARAYLSLRLMRGYELPDHTPREGTMESVAILRDLLREAPDHPGVHHFVIHAWEGSSFAAEAWPSCKRYFELVPKIPHGLHMPGHIYSQTGRWQDAIYSFEAAKKLELEYMAADPSYGNGHHGHNTHYLSTVYSFSGDFESAVREAQHLLTIPETEAQKKEADLFTSAYAQGFIAMLRALTQHEKWDEILAGKMLPAIARPRQEAWYAWARGIAYAGKGDAARARQEARKMEAALARFASRTKRPEPPELTVAKEELAAQILLASGKTDAGLRALEQTAQKERRLRYSEPPAYARPSYEALGHWAKRLGRRDVARRAYLQALEQFPEDAIAKRGLAELDHTEGVPSGGL